MLAVACGDDGLGSTGGGGAGGGEGAGDASSSTTGGGGPGSGASGGSGGGVGGTEIPAVEDPFEPPPAERLWSDAEVADLRAGVDAALNGIPGASHTAMIASLDSGQVLYEKSADTTRKPASNTKLFTTAASFMSLGASHRPSVRLYREGGSGDTIQGDAVLVVEHDPSTSTWFGASARQSLDAAAEALRASGVDHVTGNAVVLGEAVYGGDSLGTISFTGERGEYAAAFLQALEAAGIAVDGTSSHASGFSPPAGHTLVATFQSADAASIAHAINVPSHNEFADLWLHHLGGTSGGASTFADGFSAIEDVLDDRGVAHAGLLLNDGSGLSHDNRVSARHIVDLFRAMSLEPSWERFVESMAVSGLRGTIASRMTGPDTNARFWGKTGTLTGVVALSGVLFHRYDGEAYVASFLVNNVGDAAQARARLDQAVTVLAEDRRGEGPLPGRPALTRVADDANGSTALVTFEPVDGATEYLVWRSPDGRTWSRDDARLVTSTTFRTTSFDGSLYVKVSALNAAGEGRASSVLGARVSDDGARVLVVDGNQRHAAGPVPENPLGWGHTFAVAHGNASPLPFDSATSALVGSGEVDLANYDTVLWMLGRESTEHETFSAAEQTRVAAFVEGGGSLFVSGAELGYDLVDQGSAQDQAFATSVLGIAYEADDAGTTFVRAGDLDLDVFTARFSQLGHSEVAFADVLSPSTDGVSCLDYAAGVAGSACIVADHPTGGRVVSLGVPLESLDDPELAAKLVDLALPDAP